MLVFSACSNGSFGKILIFGHDEGRGKCVSMAFCFGWAQTFLYCWVADSTLFTFMRRKRIAENLS